MADSNRSPDYAMKMDEFEGKFVSLIRWTVNRNDRWFPMSASGGPSFHTDYSLSSSVDNAGVISIEDYVARIIRYGGLLIGRGPFRIVLVLSFIYLVRYDDRNPHLPINSQNARGLVLPAVLVAIKFLHRKRWATSNFACCGMIGVTEMIRLERSILSCVNYRLYVSHQDFYSCLRRIYSYRAPDEAPFITRSLQTPNPHGASTYLTHSNENDWLHRLRRYCRGPRPLVAATEVRTRPDVACSGLDIMLCDQQHPATEDKGEALALIFHFFIRFRSRYVFHPLHILYLCSIMHCIIDGIH